MRTAFLSIVLSAIASLATAKDAKDFSQLSWDDAVTGFFAIDSKDGINGSEANLLVNFYFMRYGGVCGAAFPVIRVRGSWRADTLLGYGGVDAGPIIIDAKRGVISWRHGKKLAPPWTELRNYVRALDKWYSSKPAKK